MNRTKESIRRVKIVYFTGTGSTERVAGCFEASFRERGALVEKCELRKGQKPENGDEDLLVVLYPVHACNAPAPVYEWISGLSKVNEIPAAVISVSGGGEITPNTACRVGCIRRLEKMGYIVGYENMIVMPSNWIVPTVDGLAIRLLQILPSRVERMVEALLAGTVHRTKPKVWDRIFSTIGELEKLGAKQFGKRIEVNESCSRCGWCIKNCPRGNIQWRDDRPSFGSDCLLCLKCIYGCPEKALKPTSLTFIAMKEGYDLRAVEKRMEGVVPASVDELAKGYLWKGVRDYLMDEQK